MKISCPHCSQKYDIAQEDVGADFECVKCNHTFQLVAEPQSQNLMKCPDCNREISRRAESCPHCGAPLKTAKPPTPAPPPVNNNMLAAGVPKFEPSFSLLRVVLLVISLILLPVALFLGGIIGVILWAVVFFAILLAKV